MECPGCNAVGCEAARRKATERLANPVYVANSIAEIQATEVGRPVPRHDLGSGITRVHMPDALLTEIFEELGTDATMNLSCPNELLHRTDCRCHFCGSDAHHATLTNQYLDHISDHEEA